MHLFIATKAELLKESIFFLIHLFARDILVMKKLEIEKTKPTFINLNKHMDGAKITSWKNFIKEYCLLLEMNTSLDWQLFHSCQLDEFR